MKFSRIMEGYDDVLLFLVVLMYMYTVYVSEYLCFLGYVEEYVAY